MRMPQAADPSPQAGEAAGAPRTSGPVALAALLLFLALAFLPYLPILMQGGMAFGTDTVAHDVPVNLHGWQMAWREGRLPLWSHELRNGLPLAATFAFMPWYPANWLSAGALGVGQGLGGEAGGIGAMLAAHTAQWPLHQALGAWFMFLLLRALGCRVGAALVAGVAFGLAPHVVTLTYPGHLAKVQAMAWLPAPLWLLTLGAWPAAGSCHPCHRALLWVGAGMALGMPLLAGHPQIAAYAMLLAAIWCLLLAADSLLAGVGWRLAALPLAGLAVAVGVALAMGAPHTLAAAELLPQSNRAAMTYDEAVKSSYPPEELIELVVPRHRGDSVLPALGGLGWYRGRWGERLVSDYLGMVALSLAALGLLSALSGPMRLHRTLALLATAVFLAALVLCLGGYLGGIYRAFLETVPGANVFRSPATLMVLLPWAVALLAGLGAHRFLEAPGGRHSWGSIATAAIPALVPLGYMLALWAGAVPAGDTPEATRHAHAAVGASLLAGLAVPVWMALKPKVRGLAAGSSHRGKSWVPVAALLVLLMADLSRGSWPFLRAIPRSDLVARVAAEAPLNTGGTRGDVVAPSRLVPGRELALWPMLAGVAVPGGYHPIQLARFDALMHAAAGAPHAFVAFTRAGAVAGTGGLQAVQHPFVRPVFVQQVRVLPSTGAAIQAGVEAIQPGSAIPALAFLESAWSPIADDLPSRPAEVLEFHREGAARWRVLARLARVPPDANAGPSPLVLLLPKPVYPGWKVSLHLEGLDGQRHAVPGRVLPSHGGLMAVWWGGEALGAAGADAGGLVMIDASFQPGSIRLGLLLAAVAISTLVAVLMGALAGSWRCSARREQLRATQAV